MNNTKNAIVVGLGKSGLSAAEFLLQKGCSVVGVDDFIDKIKYKPEILRLENLGLRIKKELDFTDFTEKSLVIISPGIPPSHPAIALAKLHHAEILGELELACRHLKKHFCIGITGTNGKTTIAYQLAQAHYLLGQGAAYIGTIGQGNVIDLKPLDNTTPDALCLQKLLYQYKEQNLKQVCMEVSSHALVQHRVDAIAFDQAIFTNLTLDHLDYHHNMENYAAAKAMLFAGDSLMCAIINQDDEYQQIMAAAIKPHVKKLTYGMHQECDVKAVDWHMDINGTEVDVRSPWGQHRLQIKALGAFNIYNSLAVFSSLLASGYAPEHIVAVMSQLKAAPGRLEMVAQAPYVLVDYAHTPDALENALVTLGQLKKGNLWVVFGCGGDRDKTKRPVMGKIASLNADRIVITSDNPRTEDPQTIVDEIAHGLTSSAQVMQLINREEAIAYALKEADKDDIILIAGKGHEAYQQIGTVKHAFSDQAIVRRLKA